MIMMAHPAMIVQRPDMVTISRNLSGHFVSSTPMGAAIPMTCMTIRNGWEARSVIGEGDTLVVDTVSINDKTLARHVGSRAQR